MARDFQTVLFHPFEAGLIAAPDTARFVFFGARQGLELPEIFRSEIVPVQAVRGDFRALEAEGLDPLPVAGDMQYDGAMVLAGRHRGLNQRWIGEAMQRVVPGGTVLVGGTKTDGAASLRKRLSQAVTLDGNFSKHHGTVFWFGNPVFGDTPPPWSPQKAQGLVEGRFETAPGMFSHAHVDPGSHMLAQCLPPLSGRIADFGAGWGYLACRVAEAAGTAATIDLYEADYEALEAARRNMTALAPHMPARFFWHDLLAEPVAEGYDTIVMNPPFHAGRDAEPEIGAGMIRAAARALAPAGRLFMVANRRLPYEGTLDACFARWTVLREEAGFKVIEARRRA